MNTFRKALLFCLTSLLALSACQNGLKEEMKALCSRPVELDTDKMQCMYPSVKGDTALWHINDEGKTYRLVVFMDSTECMSCATGKMHGWDKFLNVLAGKGNVSCFFIFNPAREEKESLLVSLMTEKLQYPVYIDSIGIFTKTNPHIPQTSLLHTFLIDEQGKVVFVGDPRRDGKLHDLFFRAIRQVKKEAR